MTLNIQQKLSPYNHYNYNSVEYIVIHDVGTVSTAKNNADYFYGGNRGASAHYFVDGTGIIWQVVADGHGGWHVGDGGNAYGIGNTNSIGIEMCLESNHKTLPFTQAQTIELTKMLQAKYGVPNSRVVRHYDASRKRCPGSMADNDWAEWKAFKAKIDGATTGGVVVNPTPPTSGTIGVGSKVTVGNHATHWATGQAIPRWVKGQTYSILEVKAITKSNSKRQFRLSGVNSWLLEQDIVGGAPTPTPKPPVTNSTSGSYTFASTTLIRNRPSTSGVVMGQYERGEKVNFESTVQAEGYTWMSYLSFSGERRYIAQTGALGQTSNPAPTPKPPAASGGWILGTGTFKAATTINIRTEPNTGAAITGQYFNGETVVYNARMTSGGYEWIRYVSGQAGNPNRYMAIRNVNSGEQFGNRI